MPVGGPVQPLKCYLSFVEIGCTCKIQFYCQFSTGGNYPKSHRSEEQFDRSTLFTFYIEKLDIASYTIKTGFFFYFLEMLRKKWILP